MKKNFALLIFMVFSFFSMTFGSERVINVFLIGTGTVGGELINQINTNFSTDSSIDIHVVGLANSKVMYFDPNGIPLNNWKELLEQSNNAMSNQSFIDRMTELNMPHSVFVDCTSSQKIADTYQQILQANISIVTPNKKANSGAYSNYIELKRLSSQNRVSFLYDTNVGAGLPFIHTIKNIKRSGDSVVKLEAILSGTLSYLFNTYDGTVPFSQIVREAQTKGYTEPDPRDDLNGLDMARKFLILARESGLQLEMDDIIIERFLPDECFEAGSVSEFYQKLSNYDQEFSNIASFAHTNGKILRFIGTLENGKAILSLKAVDIQHPFYHLSDTDNIGSIHTQIYCKTPIVIRGPGAGASVTAANVLANIVQADSKN
jgi:aspartokinase/homoserine dehydrogenase 1